MDFETCEDVLETRLDARKILCKGLAGRRFHIGVQKKIRHFAVLGIALSGRRYNDKPSLGIIGYDLFDLTKLGGVRNRRAPEFGND